MGCHLSGGSSEGSGPPYFQTKLRPEGKKKILETPPPPNYLRVWMTGAPPPYPRALDLALQLVCGVR